MTPTATPKPPTSSVTGSDTLVLRTLSDIRELLVEAIEFLISGSADGLSEVSGTIHGRAAELCNLLRSDRETFCAEDGPSRDLCSQILNQRLLLQALLRRRQRLLRLHIGSNLQPDEMSWY